MKKYILLSLISIGLLSLGSCNSSRISSTSIITSVQEITTSINSVDKKGNVFLNLGISSLNNLNVAYGDEVEVSLGDLKFKMPYADTLTCVGYGNNVLINSENSLSLRACYEAFAFNSGIFYYDSNFKTYEYRDNKGPNDYPVTIRISEKGKYKEDYESTHIALIENSPSISKEVYSNFRPLSGGNLKENFLFRSSSPIDDSINRAQTANSLLSQYNIKYVWNLSDTAKEADFTISKAQFDVTNYTSLMKNNSVLFNQLASEVLSDSFFIGLKPLFETLLTDKENIMFHCDAGRNRTGMVAALLMAIGGASYEEIAADYMLSYINLNGVEINSNIYNHIKKNTIDSIFLKMTSKSSLEELTKEAIQTEVNSRLLKAGLTQEKLDNIKIAISK
jgi:protein tyrosine/serine phosphatase